jgi:hypothetical protein
MRLSFEKQNRKEAWKGTALAVKFQDILYTLSPDILYTFLF